MPCTIVLGSINGSAIEETFEFREDAGQAIVVFEVNGDVTGRVFVPNVVNVNVTGKKKLYTPNLCSRSDSYVYIHAHIYILYTTCKYCLYSLFCACMPP